MRAMPRWALVLDALAVATAFWLAASLPRPALAGEGQADELRACIRQFDARAFATAQACLSAGVAKQPADGLALFYLGRTYFERRQSGQAIEWLKRAVAREPGRSELHDWLGRAYGIAAQRASLVHQFGL